MPTRRERERECHELGCRAAAAAQITNRLSLQDVDELMRSPLRDTRAPVGGVHTSLHTVDRHTSSLVRLVLLLCITPLLVRERQLRHPKAFDINQIAITAPDPAEPACICNMQLRYAVSLICRQRAAWLSRAPILDGMTDSCPKHAQPSRFPVSVTSIMIAYCTDHYDSGCSLSRCAICLHRGPEIIKRIEKDVEAFPDCRAGQTGVIWTRKETANNPIMRQSVCYARQQFACKAQRYFHAETLLACTILIHFHPHRRASVRRPRHEGCS